MINKEISAERDAAWTKKNNKALLEIFWSCERDQQELIEDETDAKQAWKKFEQIYQAKDTSSIQGIYNEFPNLRKEKDETDMQFIAQVKSHAKQLIAAGEVISDTILFDRILVGIGLEYEFVKAALSLIDNLSEAKLTSSLMAAEARLAEIAESTWAADRSRRKERSRSRERREPSKERRHRSRERRERSRSRTRRDDRRQREDMAVYRNRSPQVTCRDCGRMGHTLDTCWETHPKLRDQANAEKREKRQDWRKQQPPWTHPQYTQTAAFAEAMSNLGWKKDETK